jgi:hypothetical protein
LVDHAFFVGAQPLVFWEIETLDRAQLYVFHEAPRVPKRDSENKLWHYYATLAKTIAAPENGPRYFVWLLVLPDRPVGSYVIWDLPPHYGFFPRLIRRPIRALIQRNPFRFYDPLIKAAAREFLNRAEQFPVRGRTGWQKRAIKSLQEVCELVFITVTGDRLILSRGRDSFDPDRELVLRLRWNERG